VHKNVKAAMVRHPAMLPGSVYIHTPLPCTQFFNHDAYTEDHKHNKDFNPYLLTDEGPSTG